MENATKALYIAAGVLIGIMILSLAVMLFSGLQSYVEEYKKQIEANDLNDFNSKYQKYIQNDNLTIQDIVTVAGIAYEDNITLNSDSNEWKESDISENSLYIGVYLDNERIDNKIKDEMSNLLAENREEKYKYKINEVKYSQIGRIYRISFSRVVNK